MQQATTSSTKNFHLEKPAMPIVMGMMLLTMVASRPAMTASAP
jgi:hypothetical protein